MSRNDLKKMIVFSSETSKRIIEAAVTDYAALDNRSGSAIIEQKLLESFLPQQEDAQRYVKHLYSGASDVQDIIVSVSQSYAAGVSWQARWGNGKPLVEFALEMCLQSASRINLKDELIHHLMNSFDSLLRILKCEEQEHSGDLLERENLALSVKFGDELYQLLDKEKTPPPTSSYVNFLIDVWDYVGNSTHTYRVLSDLIAISSKWYEDAEIRVNLKELLAVISKKWGDK